MGRVLLCIAEKERTIRIGGKPKGSYNSWKLLSKLYSSIETEYIEEPHL